MLLTTNIIKVPMHSDWSSNPKSTGYAEETDTIKFMKEKPFPVIDGKVDWISGVASPASHAGVSLLGNRIIY